MEEHIDFDKFEHNKKMLELVDFINCILDINKCSEDIYSILSYMCRNGYFSNWEFKDEDIFIDGQQITKNGIFAKSEEATEKLSNEHVDLGLPSGTLWAKCNIGAATEHVDLGLPSGTLWAKCNVGAETETDYGDYFMWGSTTPDTNTPCDWMHAPFNNGSSSFDETYFNTHKSEWLTEEGNLKPQYDAAHAIMGGYWRMPTKTDFDELLEGTTNEWVTNYQGSGVNGILFTSKKNGNTMFMPAAGSRCGSSFYGQGDNGVVWSSLLYTDYLGGAWGLYFDSCSCYMYDDYRYGGFSVRGVLNK